MFIIGTPSVEEARLTVFWKLYFLWLRCYCNKVQQSRYRPGVAQRVRGSSGSQISWQRHRMVVGCQPYTPTTFTPQGMLLVLISV